MYPEAFAAAEAEGFEAECQRARASELTLLGDAARHAGKRDKAVQAFLLLRRRFAGTSEAALAAFALGRLEFDANGAYPRAAQWFRTYLAEQRGGALAREALGRLIESLHRAGDQTAARELSVTYLRDYPAGPHAELASRLVSKH
jgi:TolA-binding protein